MLAGTRVQRRCAYDMILSLADLVSPESVDSFIRTFADKTRWLMRTAQPDRARALLPWPEIDRLVAGNCIPPDDFIVLLNSNVIDRRLYRDEASGALQVAALQDLSLQGASFGIFRISALVPQIAELTAAMERALGVLMNANCHVSFGKFSAFRPHFDVHDVLVLQVHGSKRWRSFGIQVANPLRGPQIAESGPPIWEDVLGPGDLLYLPRGEVHAAVPEDRPSVHLTFGIRELTGVDFLRWLLPKAEADPELRQGISRRAEVRRRNDTEAAIKRRLHRLIDDTPILDYLLDDDRKRPPRPLPTFDLGARLGPGIVLLSALRRRLTLDLATPGDLAVEIGGRQIRLSLAARRVLDLVAARDRVAFDALAIELQISPGDSELRDAVLSLARHGLVGVVD